MISIKAQIISHESTRTSMSTGGPVLGGHDLQHLIQASLSLEAVIDELPGTGNVWIYLTLAVL
jgi:hypothetical protein